MHKIYFWPEISGISRKNGRILFKTFTLWYNIFKRITMKKEGIRMMDYQKASFAAGGLAVCLQGEGFSVPAHGTEWRWREGNRPRTALKDGSALYFDSAAEITRAPFRSGVGEGVRTSYRGFAQDGERLPLAFDTLVWVENSTGDLRFEWIPIEDGGIGAEAVYWPGPMEFCGDSADWYTVLNIQQGLLVPNNWPVELGKIHFDGQLCTAAAYMPWFGQVRPGGGYIAICETPWDAAYQAEHPAGGPYTQVSFRWLPSLGLLTGRRIARYSFRGDCDYNDLCKIYRAYAKETGLLTTLAEKAARNPNVDRLIGAGVVHKGIKTHVSPGSLFYDPEHPEKNDCMVPFSAREAEIRRFHDKGVEQLYLHLDGWGQPGYDNQHPDYLPACAEAGGWEGLKSLSDTLAEYGYLFGLHDQYRDYYFDAATFDPSFACQNPDGSIFDQARWAGGRQSYLCASQAPYYVKRNFEEVLAHGIRLAASYLDVFTCNEPDECANPDHRMTRKECLEYRAACFDYLTSRGIVPSSEEVTDWAVKSLVFAHYGPYDFMLSPPGSPRKGIPAPLYNLVYHDCMILPWPMEQTEEEDYMLYALLNGGAAYLDREGAYPNTDGAFDLQAEKKLDEQIRRWRIVSALQKRVAKCEMVRHELLTPDGKKQRTVFSDGTEVTVDFRDGSYQISDPA